MSSTLGGKVAILYGGGPISAGVVDAFAREGAHVILAGRNADKIRAIEVEQKSRGYSIDTVVLNAMDPELTNTFVGDVAERLGRVDVSFNLISLGDVQKPLLELDVDEFERPISAAMRSHFITIQAAARHMVPQGSGVILLFGGGGPQTLPGLGGFKVALDAMEGLRRQWALELGRHGIRVVTIKTGGIPETIDESSTRREEIARSIEEATLLKRAATLNDLGNVAVFLASDKSRAITATDINISAGSIID